MKTIFSTATVFLVFLAVAAQAQVVDDFSQGNWTRFISTPGKVSMDRGKLHLKDGRESPAWITVSKTFSVDVDKTPLFVVKVSSVSDRGTVKLIRKKPYDKRVALEMDRPGLYAIDMRERFDWQGSVTVEVCLYAIGAEEEITYEYVKFAAQLTQEEEDLISNRTAGGNVKLNVAPFELVPLFNTCSFYFKNPKRDGLTVAYRKKDGPWLSAYAPVYVKEDGMYRGGIVDLEEDTPYELRITAANGDELARRMFRTWSSQVPIGKTINLDETTFSGQLIVQESGSPQGWIKITAKDGFVLQNDREGPLIELNEAKYVMLEGLISI